MLNGREPEVKYYEMVRKLNNEKLIKQTYDDYCEWENTFPITARSGIEIFGEFITDESPTIT